MIKRNPANRDRLLSMDAKGSAKVMRRWSSFLTSDRAHFGGMEDQELSSIAAPALIIQCMFYAIFVSTVEGVVVVGDCDRVSQ